VFDFELTPEQRSLRDGIREFGRTHVLPNWEACENERRLMPEIAAAFHDAGFAKPWFRADGDAAGLMTAGALIAEELGYADPAYASYLMLPVLFNHIVLGYLSGGAKEALLEELEREHVVTSFAASERAAGSDFDALAVHAEPNDVGYTLNGRKEYSSNLRYARYVIVVARTAPGAAMGGLTWFFVPMDAEGVAIGPRWDSLGMRAIDISPLELTDVQLPLDRRLGDEGRGMWMFNEHLAQSRTGVAAMAVGIARRARDVVLEFGLHRRVYGDKLTKLQDYRFRIAEMEVEIAAARSLVAMSARKRDAGLDHGKEASIAKLYAGQTVMRVTSEAVMMLGSVGYTGQSIAEKLMRDARHVSIVEGPDPIHKEMVFAHLLRRGTY
jgi:alkylation response protein AidB-like acyl-CoA dehydrogenase